MLPDFGHSGRYSRRVPASLPAFSKGLKLVRIATLVMLLQLATIIVISLKAFVGASTGEGAMRAVEWFQYCMLASTAATFLMLVGMLRAIPEIARAQMSITSLVVASVGFAIATAALAWTYHVFANFVDVARDPGASADRIASAIDDMGSVKTVTILKDLAYAVGLIAVLRTLERSAAINDQLALRDEAASMSRALIVMLVADLFYQLTYGLGGGVGLLGVTGSLLVAGYWIYCHVRLTRFLANAAYFVNEPHDLPLATVVRSPNPSTPRPPTPRPQPAKRPATAPVQRSAPASPPPARPPAPLAPPPPSAPISPPAPAPRPASSTDGEPAPDGPRFLR